MSEPAEKNTRFDSARIKTLTTSESMLSYCQAARWEALYEASQKQLQLLQAYSKLAVSGAQRIQLREDLIEITANNRRVSDLTRDYRRSIAQSIVRRKQGSAMQRLTREIQQL